MNPAHTELKHLGMTSRTILCEANDRLRTLSFSLRETGEFERGALIRDLHAEITKTIPLITLRLSALRTVPEGPDALPHAQVTDSFHILDRTLRQLRALVADVRDHNA